MRWAADRTEAVGATGELANRTPEEAAVSDFLLTRQTGFPRATDVVARATAEGAISRMGRDAASAADPAPRIVFLTDGLSRLFRKGSQAEVCAKGLVPEPNQGRSASDAC